MGGEKTQQSGQEPGARSKKAPRVAMWNEMPQHGLGFRVQGLGFREKRLSEEGG